MKKRTIFATIAVALIAGASIFAACKKEEKKNDNFSQLTAINKDGIQFFGSDTTVIAYNCLANTYGTIFNFNYDQFVLDIEDSASRLAGCDVIVEDIQIIDDSLKKINWDALLKISLYCPVYDENVSLYFVEKKYFKITGEDLDLDTTICYALPDGGSGGVYPIVTCERERGMCNHGGHCEPRVEREDGRIISAYCICVNDSEGTGGCRAIVNYNNGGTPSTSMDWDTIINAIAKIVKQL